MSKRTKCLLCTAVVETGPGFYDHLEDIHMMPIRRIRIGENGKPREESHRECMERFMFNHKEYGTELCLCPDCVGGETLKKVNEVSSKHGQLYIKWKHNVK